MLVLLIREDYGFFLKEYKIWKMNHQNILKNIIKILSNLIRLLLIDEEVLILIFSNSYKNVKKIINLKKN